MSTLRRVLSLLQRQSWGNHKHEERLPPWYQNWGIYIIDVPRAWFCQVGKSTMSELKERFGNDKVAFIRFGFFLGSRWFITITHFLLKWISFDSCDVTKRENLIALYENCEEHFGAKVTSSTVVIVIICASNGLHGLYYHIILSCSYIFVPNTSSHCELFRLTSGVTTLGSTPTMGGGSV